MQHASPAIGTPPPRPVNLDPTDREILRELERDARMPWAELGRRVALSSPAVRERVRRLERTGVLTGWHASVDAALLGRPIGAFVRIATESLARGERLTTFAVEQPEVIECHGLTGEDSFLLRVQVASMQDLERLTTSLSLFGKTTTSLILASPVARRELAAG
ncbi:MAG: transcriptional regulator, AsnC family protein [Thermoleophilia bacterium]|nr:transcriptional regulator, AsnC family protein [Thermoleophilia bacterium]